MNTFMEFSQMGKVYDPTGVAFEALKDVSLRIAEGEFISLIGHSGCGKSTVLNIVAGLEQATYGGLILGGKEVNEPGPDRAVVFLSLIHI